MSDIDIQPTRIVFATRSTRTLMFLFILVGGTAALGYVVICTIFSQLLGVRPAVASLLGYGIAIPPAYSAQKLITFRSGSAHKIAFPKYLVVQMVSNMNAAILGEIFIAILKYPTFPSFVIIAGFVGFTNFFVLRYWTFSQK